MGRKGEIGMAGYSRAGEAGLKGTVEHLNLRIKNLINCNLMCRLPWDSR